MTAAPPVPSGPARDTFSALPRLDRHKPKCGPVRPSKAGRRRAWVLIGVHVLVGIHVVQWLATGRTLTPVEPSEAMQTVEAGRVNAGFLLFLGLIATTLVFGRWFCGWACHVVALQDGSAWLLGRLGLKPRPVRSRLLVFAPWVVAFHMFAWPVVSRWLAPYASAWPAVSRWLGVQPPLLSPSEWHFELTTSDLWKTFPGPLMGGLTFVVVGGLIVWWLGAKGFCTYGCPYGAFFAVADRVAPMRIRVTDACEGCGHCTSVCSSNVRVHEEVAKHGMIVDPGCMKCMDCVSVCPKDALYYGLGLPQPFAISQQRIRARGDFTWPEEIVMAVIAFVATQWTFRGAWFGEGLPFLMAVGLGAITAVFAAAAWRLVRRPSLTFQHTALKTDGTWTRAGRWVFAGLVAWLLFSVHTLIAQRWRAEALATAQTPLWERLNERKDVARERFAEAHAAVDGALGFDLVDDPLLLQARGLLRRELERHEEAEADLGAALQKAPDLEHAGTALAIYRLRASDFAAAERLARGVLAHYPANPTALAIVRQIEAKAK